MKCDMNIAEFPNREIALRDDIRHVGSLTMSFCNTVALLTPNRSLAPSS